MKRSEGSIIEIILSSTVEVCEVDENMSCSEVYASTSLRKNSSYSMSEAYSSAAQIMSNKNISHDTLSSKQVKHSSMSEAFSNSTRFLSEASSSSKRNWRGITSGAYSSSTCDVYSTLPRVGINALLSQEINKIENEAHFNTPYTGIYAFQSIGSDFSPVQSDDTEESLQSFDVLDNLGIDKSGSNDSENTLLESVGSSTLSTGSKTWADIYPKLFTLFRS